MACYQPWVPTLPQVGRGLAVRHLAGQTTKVTAVLLAEAKHTGASFCGVQPDLSRMAAYTPHWRTL